ncbi:MULTISPECIES: thioesterase II family protein [Streptomyces]|uniref:Thioesterase II family protein n=1 Tax=Streptomyces lienomycini TaxID=284035 RepID=A0ABV9X4M9_9ACTN|nr:alpha/beta fold hydrolase [Streptomyces sp. NBC_00334]
MRHVSPAPLLPARVEDEGLDLYVFAHAGGSSLMYQDWAAHLPAHWRLLAQDAPGHGLRIGEPLLTDADALVEHYLDRITRDLAADGAPFAFFGHSMGAMVAHELTRRLTERGGPRPVWLGVSGCRAPAPDAPATTGAARPPAVLHAGLSDPELRHRLAALGGTPARVLDSPELWSFFAPVVRADLRLLETWRHTPALDPLPVPVSAFCGSSDAAARPDQMARWSELSDRFLGLRPYPGGHFYFQSDPGALVAAVVRDIRAAVSTDRAGTPAGTR